MNQGLFKYPGKRALECIYDPQMLSENLIIFKFEPTTPNMSQHIAVAKRKQHATPNNIAICSVEMLRSFGRGFTCMNLPFGGRSSGTASSHQTFRSRDPFLFPVYCC